MHKEIINAYKELRKVRVSELSDIGKARHIVIKGAYSGIISDLNTLAKNKAVEVLPDVEVIKYLTQTIKSYNKKVIDVINDDSNLFVINAKIVVELLESFLPKKMALDEIENVLVQNNLQSMKEAVSYFKDNFAYGTYDNADISTVLRSM